MCFFFFRWPISYAKPKEKLMSVDFDDNLSITMIDVCADSDANDLDDDDDDDDDD